jgi:hypothetical protein
MLAIVSLVVDVIGDGSLTTATATGVGTSLGFGFFGKRRRRDEQAAADAELAERVGTGVVAAAKRPADAPAAAAAPAAAWVPADDEVGMPRWRRPSLILARKADPARDLKIAPRMSFEHGLVGAVEGREHRLIRYNVVRLLDGPDQQGGRDVGFVDKGDEVQLLEKRGAFWLILCPDGRQGWIHKMTLGAVVGEPGPANEPPATTPAGADSWTTSDDVDGDVMAAYLASRRRA